MLRRIAIISCVFALIAASCGDDDDANGATAGDDVGVNQPTARPEGKPEVVVPAGAAPSELEVTDLVVGDGEEASEGDIVTAEYVAVFHKDGIQFDSSWDRGQPLSFAVGTGIVIAGLDQGVEGMKIGGRRQLIIPPDLAFGDAGSVSGVVGPGETLVFVVDLTAVDTPVTIDDVELPDGPATELVIEDLIVGDGAVLITGASVSAHYIGVAVSTGEVFDASWERGQPIQFQLGVGGVIPGWDEGLVGMKVGGRRRLVIPPEMAYGLEGEGELVGETLVFVVDLVDVS